MLESDDEGLENDVVRINSIEERYQMPVCMLKTFIQTINEDLKTKQNTEKIGKGKSSI